MIIKSLLDTDLYKLTMQAAVLKKCPEAKATYVFNDRRKDGKFTDEFNSALINEVEAMEELSLRTEEANFLMKRCPFLGRGYIDWLMQYSFDSRQVITKVVNGQLELSIEGTWLDTILWEVPLMATISELYFRHCDTAWELDKAQQTKQIDAKAKILEGTHFADFGTRRRRSFETQNLIVRRLTGRSGFVGTSNVYFAMLWETKPIGTMAHEWIMGFSALESLRHANRYALQAWADVFKGNLGIALTDTFGSDAFFEDFDGYLGRLFDGVRHDSGCPYEFMDKTLAAYQALGIDPATRTIVYSDGLNPEEAAKIAKAANGRIKTSFGIGTNFTNDFPGSKPLNMVIKLSSLNGIPVVKLSDVATKAIGDRDALRVANWTFLRKPLDETTN